MHCTNFSKVIVRILFPEELNDDQLTYDITTVKGQLISKWFLGVVHFLQKTNENMSTWGIIVVKSNSFVHFLDEIDDPKKPFRN